MEILLAILIIALIVVTLVGLVWSATPFQTRARRDYVRSILRNVETRGEIDKWERNR